MRRFLLTLAVLSCLVTLSYANDPVDNEKETASRVASVSLFKNGLAVVKREVDLAGPGVYRLSDVPEPVHGTFMVESAGGLEARVEVRDSKGDDSTPLGVNLQEELAGLTVTIHGRNNKPPVTGQVVPPPKKDPDAPGPVTYGDESYSYRAAPAPPPASRFLILKTAKGMSYVELGDIASLETEGHPTPRMQRKPVLLLEAGKASRPGKVVVSYLTHGLSWAPSYRVDISDPKKLSIEQHAVIRNELAALSETDIHLISGYPSVQFAHVISPLAAQQSWQHFFQQLGQGGRELRSLMSNTAQIAYNPRVGGDRAGRPAVAPNVGDTIDLNFHSIGKRTLKKGSSLALATGRGEAEYERVVDWTIPDNRNEWGSPIDHHRQVDPNTGDPVQDDVWDALKFRNPLPFPMTTAPAMVVSNGNFNGQRQVLWTNRGESATLRVNKALSLRTKCVEFEEQKGANGVSEREIIYIGGRRFRQATVNGELRLCNHRGADAKLIIKRHFSGDLVKADGEPKVDLREEGIWTVNKRNELVWTLTLKPGEERNLAYQYKVLVHF